MCDTAGFRRRAILNSKSEVEKIDQRISRSSDYGHYREVYSSCTIAFHSAVTIGIEAVISGHSIFRTMGGVLCLNPDAS